MGGLGRIRERILVHLDCRKGEGLVGAVFHAALLDRLVGGFLVSLKARDPTDIQEVLERVECAGVPLFLDIEFGENPQLEEVLKQLEMVASVSPQTICTLPLWLNPDILNTVLRQPNFSAHKFIGLSSPHDGDDPEALKRRIHLFAQLGGKSAVCSASELQLLKLDPDLRRLEGTSKPAFKLIAKGANGLWQPELRAVPDWVTPSMALRRGAHSVMFNTHADLKQVGQDEVDLLRLVHHDLTVSAQQEIANLVC